MVNKLEFKDVELSEPKVGCSLFECVGTYGAGKVLNSGTERNFCYLISF